MTSDPSEPSSRVPMQLSNDNPQQDDQAMMRMTETSRTVKEIIVVIDNLKEQVAAKRRDYVKRKMEETKHKLARVTMSKERNSACVIRNGDGGVDLLTRRQNEAINVQNGIYGSNGDKNNSWSPDDSSVVLIGPDFQSKGGVRPIKISEIKKLPPYTTWIFLERNQRMSDDQSVVGRRRIYYDQNGGETLICSDSEEEVVEDEEEKKEFTESEDYILRMTIDQVGISDVVLDLLGQCLLRKPCDVQARYEVLCKEGKSLSRLNSGNDNEETSQSANPYLDKDLEAALDSFDNLFCRRCFVFDCRLHGCSQDLVLPTEKLLPRSPLNEGNGPCNINCYRLARKSEDNARAGTQVFGNGEEEPGPSSDGVHARILSRKKSTGSSIRQRENSGRSESASSNAQNAPERSHSDTRPEQDNNLANQSLHPPKAKSLGKSGMHKKNKRDAELISIAIRKRQKPTVNSDLDCAMSGVRHMKLQPDLGKQDEDASSSQKKVNSSTDGGLKKKDSRGLFSNKSFSGEVPSHVPNHCTRDEDDSSKKEEFVGESSGKQVAINDKSWNPLEKSLFEKGLEIFGRNSCFMAKYLLNGLKTCLQIYEYMSYSDNKLSCEAGDSMTKLECSEMGNEVRRRPRFVRRRGRVRRLKFTLKAAGYHSIRKRISERKGQPCRQYNPCACGSACGKQCPCLLNGTCCEKYCGCPKICKNRFRGCHCAKSQCRSRQCPCFAANRECDPDVCRNCWVSCGDGTLGVPYQRGDNYECRNMKLLLRQQQRVLLGRSDVSGWGAFLKNSVAKHEYLGEYTGELISHREADKRGKIYDRVNSSFLFNLNDQFVLDAYRKGDKLKFANHSPDPNCYAKVIMVTGDHRVGIFANERINAGEELFYDYRYEPERAPPWARKPDAPGSKKDDAAPSSGRPKKIA